MSFLPIPQALVDQYRSLVEAANDKARKFKAATEGVDENIDSFINESDNDNVIRFREYRDNIAAKIAELQAALKENTEKIREFAHSQVAEELDFDPEELRQSYLADRRAINTQKKAFSELFTSESIEEAMADVVELIGFSGTRTGGTGTPRPRLEYVTVNGDDVDGSTFSAVSAYIREDSNVTISAGDIGKAAFESAGSTDWRSFDSEQTFTLTAGDNTYTIAWLPKQD